MKIIEKIYIILNEGEVIYVSEDKDSAVQYMYNKIYENSNKVLSEWGNDDPTSEDVDEATIQAGCDYGDYDIKTVAISNLDKETIDFSDGTEIYSDDIFEKMDKNLQKTIHRQLRADHQKKQEKKES